MFPDVISTIPWDLLFLGQDNASEVRPLRSAHQNPLTRQDFLRAIFLSPSKAKMIRLLRVLRIVKLTRILRASRILTRLENRFSVSFVVVGVATFVVVLLTASHW